MSIDDPVVPPRLPSADLARVIDACRLVGNPCAVAGLTLAVLRGWIDGPMPPVPQLVAPATREPLPKQVVSLRRVERWDQLEIVEGPWGLPWLGVLDGVITLAPHCDDGVMHTLIQRLAYDGQLDVAALMGRRRTGLPGSARISRVGGFYLVGFDSPREVEVYNVLRFYGAPPGHLNVSLRAPSGVMVGPFDGYADCGAAYEVDGVEVHTDPVQVGVDARKADRAERIGIQLVRFMGEAITSRRPMLEAWGLAREGARGAAALGLEVIHLPGRSCLCGYRPGEPVD